MSGLDHLRKLINVIDQLRDVGLDNQITLPRICVLGTQSSGKSSLLESIVGYDFLPKGEGVVTRTPLELRLVKNSEVKQAVAEFEQLKGQKFTDFAVVKQKVNEITESIAGKKKGIVNKPIKLTITSAVCPDLTLIDLPGITKIPLENSEQPKNIEEITKNMCRDYCKDAKTIILCVIPANQDISTSESLTLAKILDPDGQRTIGVLTKVDIMDMGTDARKILLGSEVSLRLGYIAVKNRSQFDLNGAMKVDKALEEERKFFSTHKVYSSMPSSYFGIENLTKKLMVILNSHIRQSLPGIKSEINEKIASFDKEFKSLGTEIPLEQDDKRIIFWDVLRKFCTTYNNLISGTYDKNEIVSNKKQPGAEIKETFDLLFINLENATNNLSNSEIDKAINLHEGEGLPGFHSIDAFLYLLQPLLEKFRVPAINCVKDVMQILEDTVQSSLEYNANKFPSIKDILFNIIHKYMEEEKEKCIKIVKAMIDSETGYLFTNDENLMKKDPGEKEKNAKPMNRSEYGYQEELRTKVTAYYKKVYSNLKDLVPKMIGYYLVKASQENIHGILASETLNNDLLIKSFTEPNGIIEERKEIKKRLEILRKAKNIINQNFEMSQFVEKALDGKTNSEEKGFF